MKKPRFIKTSSSLKASIISGRLTVEKICKYYKNPVTIISEKAVTKQPPFVYLK